MVAVGPTPLAQLAATASPLPRKIVSEFVSPEFSGLVAFTPGSVDLAPASGGFNSVVEVSAESARRLVDRQIGSVSAVVRRAPERLAGELAALDPPLAGAAWQSLYFATRRTYGIGFALELTRLELTDPARVTLTFSGRIGLWASRFAVPRLPDRQRYPVPGDGVESPPVHALIGPAQVLPDELISTAPEATGTEGLELAIDGGGITLQLVAPYRLIAYPPQKAADVVLDLQHAVLTPRPDAGDATILYSLYRTAFHFSLAHQLAPAPMVKLIPTTSLVGANAAFFAVPELADFYAHAGHVASDGRQAIFVAFDVVPGCRGILEDVQHFIGGNDYGVIHDDYVVQRVLLHKWNRGGFHREMRLVSTTQVKVKRNGHEGMEDATVRGRLLLDTLDSVAMETDSVSRTDSIRLTGDAHTIADNVTLLADNTTIDSTRADLGPPGAARWAVRLSPHLVPAYDPDPEIRDFQIRAHIDAVRHLGRPLRSIALATPHYVRTEAVTKRYFVLGRLAV